MTDEAEILWRMCNEHYTQSRQHETLRAQMTTFSSAIAAASLAFVGQGGLQFSDLPLTVMLVALGVFGALLCAKHYERFAFHVERAREHRVMIERLLPGADLSRIRKDADARHTAAYPKLYPLRLHQLWMGLHFFIGLLGLVLTLLILI